MRVKEEDRRTAHWDVHCRPPHHSPHAEDGLERFSSRLSPVSGGCSILLKGLHNLRAAQNSSQQQTPRRESSPVTKGPYLPQHQYTNKARGARRYLLISWSWFELTKGRSKGSLMFKQLAKALGDARLHQSLQVFVFPHPNHVS